MIMLLDRSASERPPVSVDNAEMLSRTVVIIPARNEQLSIGLVLADLPKVAKVIVVNNGSNDATALVACNGGANVVDEEIAGYGRACRSGLYALLRMIRQCRREARDNDSSEVGSDSVLNVEYVVFLDADYSDHPELLAKLVEPIHCGRADFVLGSRLLGDREPGAMPIQSILGNKLACFLMRVIWRGRYTDLGPFRAIRYESLKKLQMKDTNFGWTIEMQIKAMQHGLRTIEVPVPYRRRIGASKISGTVLGTFRAGYKILYTIGKYAFWGSPIHE